MGLIRGTVAGGTLALVSPNRRKQRLATAATRTAAAIMRQSGRGNAIAAAEHRVRQQQAAINAESPYPSQGPPGVLTYQPAIPLGVPPAQWTGHDWQAWDPAQQQHLRWDGHAWR